MTEAPQHHDPKRKVHWEYWTTVSYRTVGLLAMAGFIIFAAIVNAISGNPIRDALDKLFGGEGSAASVQQASFARFLNLDGSVRVKKRDAVQWANADYRTELQEGDIVQTGPQGIARIVFIDGTTYVVKPDTLIVIEQNATLANSATKVAVQVSSGAVDLSTGSWEVPGSSSEVRFENAVARMNQNTRAAIRQDPDANVHEITVSEGSANLRRGSESVQVGPYERTSFRGPDEALNKERILAPPKLARPRNLEPIISTNPKNEVIRFAWEPVTQARNYRLRVSTSPLFTTEVINRVISTSSFNARGLAPGEYYWSVRAMDAQNRESPESEPNRFTLAEQPATEQLLLVIDSITQHGRVIEVMGRTEPGASVTVNAEAVAYVGPDGKFRHFTSPLQGSGAHTITIVAQNPRGEVVTRKQPVLIK